MLLRAEDITIAVTVYSRRDFVCDAIRSALDQTVPVQVIVVEDCGPDAGLRDFILREFGGRHHLLSQRPKPGPVRQLARLHGILPHLLALHPAR